MYGIEFQRIGPFAKQRNDTIVGHPMGNSTSYGFQNVGDFNSMRMPNIFQHGVDDTNVCNRY